MCRNRPFFKSKCSEKKREAGKEREREQEKEFKIYERVAESAQCFFNICDMIDMDVPAEADAVCVQCFAREHQQKQNNK